jgi:prolyl oligopeptidase
MPSFTITDWERIKVCLPSLLHFFSADERLGQDILVLKDSEHPDWQWAVGISEIDGRYLELNISKDTNKVRASED